MAGSQLTKDGAVTLPITAPFASADEGYEVIPAGIGNDSHSRAGIWYVVNDRILYDWPQFAGRWDDKTISAKRW
jgi:hypothetical protein